MFARLASYLSFILNAASVPGCIMTGFLANLIRPVQHGHLYYLDHRGSLDMDLRYGWAHCTCIRHALWLRVSVPSVAFGELDA